jgi:LPPG:FO 2-phospho-L-lactate transferase
LTRRRLVVALSGGVGGAKLALGLSRVLPPEELLVVANTGDDFEHLGLSVSPDLDTLMYALAGLDNQATGWGRRDESWNFMAALAELGDEIWFCLGDRDLATHVERTRRLRAGETLSAVTDDLCRRLRVGARILPMSDDKLRTRVRTEEHGWLDFQHWFVRLQAAPAARELAFVGAGAARPLPEVMAALASGTVRALVVCPSNPFISVGPILAVPGLREAIEGCGAPVVAVSPVIGGAAVKGPTARMMRDLSGMEPSAAAVARHYGSLLQGYVMDERDAAEAARIEGPRVTLAPTLMAKLEDKVALARVVLDAADALRG